MFAPASASAFMTFVGDSSLKRLRSTSERYFLNHALVRDSPRHCRVIVLKCLQAGAPAGIKQASISWNLIHWSLAKRVMSCRACLQSLRMERIRNLSSQMRCQVGMPDVRQTIARSNLRSQENPDHLTRHAGWEQGLPWSCATPRHARGLQQCEELCGHRSQLRWDPLCFATVSCKSISLVLLHAFTLAANQGTQSAAPTPLQPEVSLQKVPRALGQLSARQQRKA